MPPTKKPVQKQAIEYVRDGTAIPFAWKAEVDEDGYVELKPRIAVKKPIPEPHDENNPISRLLSMPTFAFHLRRPVQVLDMGDVLTCDICGNYARVRHFGMYCCKKCDEIVRGCVLCGVVQDEPCLRKKFMEEDNCDGRCFPCRMSSTLTELIKIRERRQCKARRELKDDEEFPEQKLRAKEAFLDWHVDHAELERYGGDDFRLPCTEVQHLNDAFEASFLKFVENFNSMIFLRTELDNADRTALVKSYAAEHFIFECMRRSQQIRGFRRFEVFELDSDWAYIRNDEKIRKELLGCLFEANLRSLVIAKNYKIDDEEYAYMRAISFFNPKAPGLKNESFVSKMNEWFTKKFKESLERKKAEGKRKKVGHTELERFKAGVVVLAEMLLIVVGKVHTKKSDLMKELCKPDKKDAE